MCFRASLSSKSLNAATHLRADCVLHDGRQLEPQRRAVPGSLLGSAVLLTTSVSHDLVVRLGLQEDEACTRGDWM